MATATTKLKTAKADEKKEKKKFSPLFFWAVIGSAVLYRGPDFLSHINQPFVNFLCQIVLTLGVLTLFCLAAQRYVMTEARDRLEKRRQEKIYNSKYRPSISVGPTRGAWGDIQRLSPQGLVDSVYAINHKNGIDKALRTALADLQKDEELILIIASPPAPKP